jgi:hypothetical protein
MVGDTLSDAVIALDEYLAIEDLYEGELREFIIAIRDKMDRARERIDAATVWGVPIGETDCSKEELAKRSREYAFGEKESW